MKLIIWIKSCSNGGFSLFIIIFGVLFTVHQLRVSYHYEWKATNCKTSLFYRASYYMYVASSLVARVIRCSNEYILIGNGRLKRRSLRPTKTPETNCLILSRWVCLDCQIWKICCCPFVIIQMNRFSNLPAKNPFPRKFSPFSWMNTITLPLFTMSQPNNSLDNFFLYSFTKVRWTLSKKKGPLREINWM